MSKRGADVQGGRLGWADDPAADARDAMDTPKRATAAQMAQRKIVRARSARRPQNIGRSPIYKPLDYQQQVASPFSNINPNILSNSAPSSTDQQSQPAETSSTLQNGVNGGNILEASQSFPADNPSATQAGGLFASFSGFQSAKATSTDPSAPKGSMFNFSIPAKVNNPFTSIPILHPESLSGIKAPSNGDHPGFKGSIFNMPAGMDSVPRFAPIPPEILDKSTGEADKSTQPESTQPAKPSDTAQTPSTTKIFGHSAAQQEKATPAPTNIFGQPSVQPAQTPLSTSSIFGQTSVLQNKITPSEQGSHTSNVFRDILKNSKAEQKERLTNGVNGANPVSQTTPLQVQPPKVDTKYKFMEMPPPAPAHFTEDQRKEYVTLFRIYSLDFTFQKYIASMTELKPGAVEHAVRFYTETHEKIVAAGGLPQDDLQGIKRKFTGDETPDESGGSAKRSKPESEKTPTPQTTQRAPVANMGNNFKGSSQPAVLGNIFGEVSARNSKPESETTPTPQTTQRAPVANMVNNFKGNSQPAVMGNIFGEVDARNSKPESEKIPTPQTNRDPRRRNIFDNLKGDSQPAVTGNIFGEVDARNLKPESEKTPTPQTSLDPRRRNIFNNLKGDSPVPVTNVSSNGAGAATPSKFSVPTFKAPTFGAGKPVNFLAQFGQSAAESERKEKAKRKAEDFDSDEDDEAEWERKYAEEQRVKKQKLAEEAKGKTTKFVPGKGFVIEEDEQSTGATAKATATPSIFTASTVGGASVFDSPAPQTSSMPNIFGHLSDKPLTPTPGRSLFDRISKDENGNSIRELPKSTANSLLAPSAATSVASSRATSPGITTDTGGESESNAEGAEAETTKNAEQLDLTTAGPGEEEEDVLFEVRAKAMMWLAEAKDEQTKPGWQNKGIGPFRVLKHRKTGKVRIIMRLDPSGRLVLNAALLAGVKYEHQAPAAVKMAIASEDGKLRTWVIKVRKDEDAMELASILEENKSN